MKSEDKIDFVIKRCTQSAHYKYLFPGTEHQYTSTISNQTFSLVEESDAQTIPTSGHTWKSVDQPWKYQILEKEEEDQMTLEQIVSTVSGDHQEYTVFSCTHASIKCVFSYFGR